MPELTSGSAFVFRRVRYPSAWQIHRNAAVVRTCLMFWLKTKMGNIFCPVEDVALLADVARGICPFPAFTPSPHFSNMLSLNSSLHLKNHYLAVQSSLTHSQQEAFTQQLKRTFGRDGRVTLGGVGVVALSLAVLFDTLAKQAKGEWVPESGPIPGVFVKNPRGYYPPQVYTVSEYLRLMPYIANNPTRMKEELKRWVSPVYWSTYVLGNHCSPVWLSCLSVSPRYYKRLVAEHESLKDSSEEHLIKEDVTLFNLVLTNVFLARLKNHYQLIKNESDEVLSQSDFRVLDDDKSKLRFYFNCDVQKADKCFEAEVLKSDTRIQEAFKKEMFDISSATTRLQQILGKDFINSIFLLNPCGTPGDTMGAHREDFDLKANSVSNWIKDGCTC